MNNNRRNILEKAKTLIEQADELIQQARDEEEEYIENMPENLQESDKAEMAQSCLDLLEEIDAQEIIDLIDQVIE